MIKAIEKVMIMDLKTQSTYTHSETKRTRIDMAKLTNEEWEVILDSVINYIQLLQMKKIPFDKILFNRVFDRLNNDLCPEYSCPLIGFRVES